MPLVFSGCMFILSIFVQVDAVYVTNTEMSGTNIRTNNCSPLGPEYTNFENTTVDGYDSDDATVVRAWVGAFVIYTPWMKYKGCRWFKKNVNPKNHTFDASPSIYTCYEKCMNTTNMKFKYDCIGMQKRACYCLVCNELNYNDKLNCESKPCGTNPEILCSQNETQMDAVVLYELNDDGTKINNTQTGSCGVFRYGDNIDKGRQQCDQPAYSACKKNNYVFGIISKNKTWAESMNCPDGLPSASFDNFVQKNSSNLTHGTYWSTSIKGSKTIPYNGINKDGKHCVAAEIKHGKLTKSYVVQYCSDKLPVLCQGNRTTTTIHTTTLLENKSVTASDIKVQNAYEFPIVIVIGSSGVVLFVASLLIIIVCCKKVKTSNSTKQNIPMEVISEKETDKIPSIDQGENRLHENAGEDNVYNHTEFVQNGGKENTDYDTMANIRAETDGIYDESSTQSRNKHIDGIYDLSVKTGRNEEDTYDVSGINQKSSKGLYDETVIA